MTMIIEQVPNDVFIVKDELTSDWTTLKKPDLRNWLLKVLSNQTIELEFEKKDGSIREMTATLKEDRVIAYEKKTDKEKNTNENIIPVFDVDKQEWRSFRIDCLKKVNFEALVVNK